MREFSVITNTYKVRFISKAVLNDGKLERKRFAIIANPSEALLENISNMKNVFSTFNKIDAK